VTWSVWRARLVVSAAVTASALAFALYARVEWPWFLLGWIGLVPWLAVLDRTRSLRGALAAGVLMCEAFVLAVFSWFPSAIENYTQAPWVLALLIVVLAAPLLQPQLITFAVARALARRSGAGLWRTAVVGASIYVGTEWAIPKLFADTIGQGQYASVFIRQAADIAGAHGITFVLIVANECLLAIVVRMRTHTRAASVLAPALCVAALVCGLFVYGAWRVQQFGEAGRGADRVTAGVVQANISKYGQLAAEMGTFDATRTILDAHFMLSTEAMQRTALDLLVWPETVYPTTFGSPKSEDGAAFDREIGAFVTRIGVPLVFGAYDVEAGDEFNAAVFLEPATDGRLAFDAYRKRWLFPLIERTPAVLDAPAVRRWLPWLGTWKAGAGPQVLSLAMRDGRALRIAPLICYDAIDPGLVIAAVRQGAEILVTLSNDSWFDWGNVPRLILIVTAFRSIETRRPQVRATNTGISAVIDATGELRDTIEMDQRATMVAAVAPEHAARTLMLAWGDWFPPSAFVVGLALLAAPVARRTFAR
jgi:apolipoprotein N-acyltransferase